jgi:hypothetical protein
MRKINFVWQSKDRPVLIGKNKKRTGVRRGKGNLCKLIRIGVWNG